MYTIQHVALPEKSEKESIHSGHFMVSHFEAEEQDDEDNVAVPIPETADTKSIVPLVPARPKNIPYNVESGRNQQQLAIDTSLSKLFHCMSLAYRQKLTSPKWNRFRGIRLRWKDKIRLNNVIWRCWHLQFIKKENTLVCQFASPLDVDTHNKPEAVVLEGKYWKRKLAAVTAEYKRWRMFYRNNILGHIPKDTTDALHDMDLLVWDSNSSENLNMMVDEDYMGLMSDTLFSTITNTPFVFPDSREIAKAGLAEFIQPSLGPLQPNLEDYMDTFDPLQEFMTSKLPTVPEESQTTTPQAVEWGYLDETISSTENNLDVENLNSTTQLNHFQMTQLQSISPEKQVSTHNSQEAQRPSQILGSTSFSNMMLGPQYTTDTTSSSYLSVISKNNGKAVKGMPVQPSKGKLQNVHIYSKSMENVYTGFTIRQGIKPQTICLPTSPQLSQPSQQQTQSQSVQQQVQNMQQYKFVQSPTPPPHNNTRQAYKFPVPSTPNIKFTSQSQQQQVQQQIMQPTYTTLSQYSTAIVPKEEKVEPRRRGTPRGRGRSRSNTREPIKRPPLISAVSDPSLLTQQTSALLTQLLANNADSVYSQSRTTSQPAHDLLSNQVRIKEECNNISSLPQPAPNTLIIPAQVSTNTASPSTSDPLLLNTFSNSNSPIMDPISQSIHSPTSSQSSIGSPSAESSHRDRRSGHIHAEQKRRYNIKNGFDMIHSLIPHLNQNPNAKLSKAAMLQKGAEYIRQLQNERNQLKEEMESLRHQIESLNTSISNCQSMLPATGAPVSRRTSSRMQEMFDEYVRNRTMENWKYWIFSLIFRPLLNSFNNFVSSSSLDDLYSSSMHWIEQHCTLVDLRPVVLNSLRYLCTKTEILSEPEKLPEEARQIVLDKQTKLE